MFIFLLHIYLTSRPHPFTYSYYKALHIFTIFSVILCFYIFKTKTYKSSTYLQNIQIFCNKYSNLT
jgi:hypothetical protein